MTKEEAIGWCNDRARMLPYLKWFVVRGMSDDDYSVADENFVKRHKGLDTVHEMTGTDDDRRQFEQRLHGRI